MDLPAAVKLRIQQFAAVFPVPQGAPGSAHEERCRQWCIKLSQQIHHDFGTVTQPYGVKKASPNRPISKDSLAMLAPDGDKHSWDLLKGAGTGKPTLATNPQHHDITDQVFVSQPPVNHLNGGPEPPEPPTPVPPMPTPCPPCTCDGPATYETSLQVDTVIARIKARYTVVHGHEPGWSDIGHNLWRWYREDRWASLEAILADIQ